MINPFNHELLLKSIIGDDLPFNIALDNNQIHITAESKEAIIAIQQRLKNNFNSTDELQKNIKIQNIDCKRSNKDHFGKCANH